MKRFHIGLILIGSLMLGIVLAHHDTTPKDPLPSPSDAPSPRPTATRIEVREHHVAVAPTETRQESPPHEIRNTQDVKPEPELNLDSIDLEAPNANLVLMDLARKEDTDPEILYDLVVNLGPQAFPALGVLADRFQGEHPERASEIIDMLFDSLGQSQEPNRTMLISWALMNVSSIDYTDQLYDSLQRATNPEVRYRLFGVLSSRPLEEDEKEKFKSLALQDPSPFIRDLGRDWEHAIEGRGRALERHP
jgi:hypothetical protein